MELKFSVLPENFSIWHQKGVNSTYNLPNDLFKEQDLFLVKGVNSTYNLPNDLFLVKQLYMGTYVFEICKILEISS